MRALPAPARHSRNQKNRRKKPNHYGHKKHKKASSHTVVSRALISAANRFLAKYDFADKKIAAPMGALLMTESTQRPFVRPLAKPRRVFFVAIGLLVWQVTS
jgi:hypothetical protein